MRIDPIFKILKQNKELYKTLNLNLQFRQILEYQEQGEEITFNIIDKQYKVGYLYITEDQDDWAQAECYQVDWCQENEKEIPTEKLIDILNNIKGHLRDTKLNKLL